MRTPTTARSRIDPADLPPARARAAGPDLREHAEEIVWAATRAPSYRNIQPWSFRVGKRQVEVFADRTRRCPVADPDDRQLFLGLGAAVFGVRLALLRLGLRPVVGLSRDPSHPDLAAVVVAAGPGPASVEEHRLFEQLARRRTVWAPFDGTPMPVSLQIDIADRVREEGAAARWLVRSAPRRMVLDLIRRSVAEHRSDPRLQQEAAAWPTAAIWPQPPPGLLVICTPDDHRAGWLRAGQALHHALLTATAAGLGASFLTEPLEVPLLRTRLRADLELPGHPQILLGMGRPLGQLPEPTPRRPLAEVLRA